jgi:asparagine synthase (glutamine-hydrolysing)
MFPGAGGGPGAQRLARIGVRSCENERRTFVGRTGWRVSGLRNHTKVKVGPPFAAAVERRAHIESMCGINAILAVGRDARVDRAELIRTRDAMRLRGPDGEGEWISADRRVGMGHRRLSIIDLSSRAAQPMERDGDVIVFNGEIYNYRALRQDLERQGVTFTTDSDTEVILRLFQREGEAMVERMRGMFAVCIWDASRQRMFLARDPYGIKPLYYSQQNGVFRVASQVKALMAGGGISTARDAAGIAGFLLRGAVPEPFTMYEAIRSLPAGSWLYVDAKGAAEPVRYFSIAAVLREAALERRQVSAAERDEVIHAALIDSVRDHLVSDVPVGAFLSSGRDSTTVAALTVENGYRPESVTLRFAEYVGTSKDEAPLAALVAAAYGIPHSIRTLTREEFRAELPRALAAMDQPSTDGLNSFFVCKAASEHGWKVALSGTGGDELFGGYTTFKTIPTLVRAARAVSMIPGLAGAFARVSGSLARRRGGRASPKTPYTFRYGATYAGAYLLKRGLYLPEDIPDLLAPELAADALARLDILGRLAEAITPDPLAPLSRVSALESAHFMRYQLLRDIDWAAMAHSLEVRVPLVDAQLLRSVAPVIVGVRNGKDILARAPRLPLPREVLDRRKTGFTIPIRRWLDEEQTAHFGMRGWALTLVEPHLRALTSSQSEPSAALDVQALGSPERVVV